VALQNCALIMGDWPNRRLKLKGHLRLQPALVGRYRVLRYHRAGYAGSGSLVGKLEEFKGLAAQCMQSVRERDLGTLQYDWFFNDTHTECVARDTYNALLREVSL
jgi:hypothetical protein